MYSHAVLYAHNGLMEVNMTKVNKERVNLKYEIKLMLAKLK